MVEKVLVYVFDAQVPQYHQYSVVTGNPSVFLAHGILN